jgi:hypothetical protein
MPEKVDSRDDIETSSLDGEAQSMLIPVKLEHDISLEGDLDVYDYLQDVAPTRKVIQDISVWTEKQREITRTKLVLWLAKLLGCSLLGTFMLIVVATFNPNLDKELIKDLIPQLVTTQGTLLGMAFGFYFSNKEN